MITKPIILDDTSKLPPMTVERRKAILFWYEEVSRARNIVVGETERHEFDLWERLEKR